MEQIDLMNDTELDFGDEYNEWLTKPFDDKNLREFKNILPNMGTAIITLITDFYQGMDATKKIWGDFVNNATSIQDLAGKNSPIAVSDITFFNLQTNLSDLKSQLVSMNKNLRKLLNTRKEYALYLMNRGAAPVGTKK